MHRYYILVILRTDFSVAINCKTVRHFVRHCKTLFLLLDEIEKCLTVYNFCKTQKVWEKSVLQFIILGVRHFYSEK